MYREKILIEMAPLLYSEYCWLDCGQGWDKIIQSLSIKLENLIIELINKDLFIFYDHPHAMQIKEKLGALKFCISRGTKEMYDLIDEAKVESLNTCELCGFRGSIRCEQGWYSVRCNTCWNKNKKEICFY